MPQKKPKAKKISTRPSSPVGPKKDYSAKTPFEKALDKVESFFSPLGGYYQGRKKGKK